MDNCTYNKTKLLHEMSKISGFIKKYAQKDAKAAKHTSCNEIIAKLQKDLVRHMEQLRKQLGKARIE